MNFQVPPIGGFEITPWFLPFFLAVAALIVVLKLIQLAVWLVSRRNKPQEEPSTSAPEVPPLDLRPKARIFFQMPLALVLFNRGYVVCRTCLWAPKKSMRRSKAKILMDAHDKECPGEIPDSRTHEEIRIARQNLWGF